MPSLTEAKFLNNKAIPSSYLPVAIFVGGTSGIGQHTAQAFTNYTNGNAHIIIVGRNESAAQSIIASFPKPTGPGASSIPGWKHKFVYCDAQLIKNVWETCKSLSNCLGKVNFLFVSAGGFSLSRRDETEEGIDKKLVLRYYSRWAFINGLLPLMKKAKELNECASIMSVLAAGMGTKVDLDDVGMKKSFSGYKAMMGTGTYNNMMMAEFAQREPGISFTHIYPGVVDTPALYPNNWALRMVMTAFAPLIANSPAHCAEYMLYALLNAKEGTNYRNEKGEEIQLKNYVGDEAAHRKIWEHTVKETWCEEFQKD